MSKREFTRSDRLASQVQKEMADLIRVHIRDPKLGMVTVSDVEVTRDLAIAKVYLTFLGGQLNDTDATTRVASYAQVLRRELGKRIRIRTVPEVRFVFDDTLARGMRIDAILESLDRHGPTDGSAGSGT
jgi:ribosome-binding factor A